MKYKKSESCFLKQFSISNIF